MNAPLIDCLLLQLPALSSAQAHAAVEQAHTLLCTTWPSLHIQRIALHAQEGSYAYLRLTHPSPISAEQIYAAEAALQALGEAPWMQCQLSRLQTLMHRDGPSVTKTIQCHYVVEMDPAEGWKDELFRWYDEEHLPGLAAVDGTVQADRYLNLDHGPLSLACYDLVEESVMGCPAWLAVRATPWSSRVRPHFTNTKRTMFTLA